MLATRISGPVVIEEGLGGWWWSGLHAKDGVNAHEDERTRQDDDGLLPPAAHWHDGTHCHIFRQHQAHTPIIEL
jgi:hypothetical protein